MIPESIYSVDKFKAISQSAEENNIFENKKKPMDLIYNIIENVLVMTPTTLQALSLETIDDALSIVQDYYTGQAKNEIGNDNPIYEMQTISTAKEAIQAFTSSSEFVGDEDFF